MDHFLLVADKTGVTGDDESDADMWEETEVGETSVTISYSRQWGEYENEDDHMNSEGYHKIIWTINVNLKIVQKLLYPLVESSILKEYIWRHLHF